MACSGAVETVGCPNTVFDAGFGASLVVVFDAVLVTFLVIVFCVAFKVGFGTTFLLTTAALAAVLWFGLAIGLTTDFVFAADFATGLLAALATGFFAPLAAGFAAPRGLVVMVFALVFISAGSLSTKIGSS